MDKKDDAACLPLDPIRASDGCRVRRAWLAERSSVTGIIRAGRLASDELGARYCLNVRSGSAFSSALRVAEGTREARTAA